MDHVEPLMVQLVLKFDEFTTLLGQWGVLDFWIVIDLKFEVAQKIHRSESTHRNLDLNCESICNFGGKHQVILHCWMW